MIVDVSKIQNSQTEFNLSFDSGEIDLKSDFAKVSGKVDFAGEISNADLRTIINGKVKTKVELNCSRCLQNVPQELEIPVKNAYILAENDTPEEEEELLDQGLEVSIFEGDKIDLSEVAGEQIALALPAQILCREDCKGLCEQCGANRNLIDCKCEDDEIDPRWAALKNLKIENEK